MNLVSYLRDSGGEEQDLSIEQQKQEVKRWCRTNGHQLSRFFIDEAQPGSSIIHRHAFQEMIDYLLSPQSEETAVIVWKFSRFARDIDDAQYYKAKLRREGIDVISIKDNIPAGRDGRLLESIIDWTNEKFLEDLSSDVKRGLNHIVLQYGAVPGTPPLGFKREPINLGKRRDGTEHIVHRWVPDPEFWDRCRRAWEMRANGASYRKIHETLHLYGSNNSYTTFFRNRIYLGELAFGDMVIQDYAPALVDQETWDRVQAMNRRRANIQQSGKNNPEDHPRRQRSRYLLSGLAYCARCGSPLNGKTVTLKGQGSRDYYACSRAKRRQDCGARLIPRQALEDAVLETLHDYILDVANLDQVQKEVASSYASQTKTVEVDLQVVNKQIRILKQQLGNLANAIAEAGHSEILLEKLRTLEQELTDRRTEQKQLEKLTKNPPKVLPEDELENLTNNLRSVVKSGNMELIHQMLHGVIAKILAERRGKEKIHGIIYYYQPPSEPNSGQEGDDNPPNSPPGKPPEPPNLLPMEKCPQGDSNHRQQFTQNFTAHIKKRSS